MLPRTLFLIVATLATTGNAWVTPTSTPPKQQLKIVEQISKTIASVGLAVAIAAGGPAIASAGTDFTGSYSDPKHPGCARLVFVDGNTALVSGIDGSPGCESGEGRPWKLTGSISGDNIFVDFSPKGGPKDLKGIWEAKGNAGIRWPDGNKWTLNGKPDF
mmetsp:Transcript_7605/g.9377  ORF Transcript_7605/g.9377 Transcript_7605/m.9377 type:complete len:160 (+) Transcript_7605:69-548(+)|eukprot:CAMPEP_0172501728 /NCGR_PEP_ID=MMETSP1066-20121228/152851_1 /TAXON_ID=671091 /ORGANISM="Coscinodiscus wailesii, Strain CCMP2513" /LENGTH=159 /DNA_ID=CAMNT_0013276683 /DNA_START=63 /DNA_END=542 /DNA_ORIENTATION=-